MSLGCFACRNCRTFCKLPISIPTCGAHALNALSLCAWRSASGRPELDRHACTLLTTAAVLDSRKHSQGDPCTCASAYASLCAHGCTACFYVAFKSTQYSRSCSQQQNKASPCNNTYGRMQPSRASGDRRECAPLPGTPAVLKMIGMKAATQDQRRQAHARTRSKELHPNPSSLANWWGSDGERRPQPHCKPLEPKGGQQPNKAP
eukprot:1146273-Pelagomonas_calceolata.AAC.3